jgi:hypothetical protein
VSDVQRIASDEAGRQGPVFEVVAVTPAGLGSPFFEVTFALRDRRDQAVERRFLIIGVSRDTSEAGCRRDVRERLHAYRVRHRLR